MKNKQEDLIGEKDLGKMHKWWLKRIYNTENKRMAIDGYSGSAYGKALDSLVERGLIIIESTWERSGMAIYKITSKGIDAIKGERCLIK